MGECRSARTVYLTLRHQYGAGDYSAVMVIKAKLRQLRCLPARGGVCVTNCNFITTWRISINQMEAAGFLPGIQHILAIFADGLPNTTIAFINLYDTIIASLNELHEQSLSNIHQLFDCTIHIENNIQRNRILHPNPRQPLPNNTPSTPTIQPPPTSPTVPNVTATQAARSTRTTGNATLICSNCGCPGHLGPTCFQPGGAMEGQREEYLASRIPKLIAHIAEINENHTDVEESPINAEENTLNNEFAALLLDISNDIKFSTYAFSSIFEISV